MKRWVIFSSIALLVGAGLLRLVQHDAGYVLIVVGGKSIEMRFWMAILILLGSVLALYSALRFGAGFYRWLRFGSWLSFRQDRQARAQQRLREGVLRVFEGDYHEADRILRRVVKMMPHDALALVACSESAMRLGHPELARKRLQDSHGHNQSDGFSVELAEIRLLITEQHFQQALAQLLVLKTRSKSKSSVSVLLMLQELLQKLEDWPALEALLSDIERSAARDLIDWPALQRTTYRQLLLASTEALDPMQEIEAVWSRVPKSLKEDPALLAVYGRLLMANEQYESLEPLVRKALKKAWSEELVELYGLLPAIDSKRQLQTAESWLLQHPEEAAVHLAVGRIALRNELWGKAREHLERSIHLSPIPVAYAELARLLDYLGEVKQSLSVYRQGLLNATPGLVSLPATASDPISSH